MNPLRTIILALAAATAVPALAGTDWWKIHTTDFYRVEQMNSSTLIAVGLKYPLTSITIYNLDNGNPCTCGQVNLTPPTGKESKWLNILLTAISTGRDVYVYGNCASSVVDADAVNSTGRIQLAD